MRVCVDVDYRDTTAVAACLVFRDWTDGAAVDSRICELPCILRVIQPFVRDLDTVVVDGYVWLEEGTTPGLGAHLFEALDSRVPVVGIAKGTI